MTREKAIMLLKYRRNIVRNADATWCANEAEALDLALSALRPISRERVERMAGEWVQDIHKGPAVFYCNSCGESFEIHSYEFQKYRFCPFCMSPMTDEAAGMVMKRLEALHNG